MQNYLVHIQLGNEFISKKEILERKENFFILYDRKKKYNIIYKV